MLIVKVAIMNKKRQSTYEKFVKLLTPKERKDFEKEYKDFLISEMLLAAMEHDAISVRKLAEAAGVSPTIVQGIRSGKRKNVSVQSFLKILHVLGYSLVAERADCRFPLNF